ncbi:uncharacterized protein LOC129946631 [Eupeodes corollae]|uniref:uncharacterized protein LOC129946631 n=1 Tax=Eupeodes corollae TaxID=290404 RepID=UPI00249284A8|nr:uncharacterized protein LOC129946631 [Eupeodes corollae]
MPDHRDVPGNCKTDKLTRNGTVQAILPHLAIADILIATCKLLLMQDALSKENIDQEHSQSNISTRIELMESVLKFALIASVFCSKSFTFAVKFVTRHDLDSTIFINEPFYHPTNHRRAYNLRYEPSDKSREISSTSNTYLNEIVKDETQNMDSDAANSYEITTTEGETLLPVTKSPIMVTEETASSESSSSIMRPDTAAAATTTAKAAQIIGEGLRNLLYGSASDATIFQAPRSKGKGFLSLFEVFKFENSKCSVSLSDIRLLHGICYHEFECNSFGGTAMGACASGVGVCCVFVKGCGDTTDQQVVYFESPNYPTPVTEALICVLIVNLRQNVRQLRLDFSMFELSRPTQGECLQDQFVVSGQNVNFIVPIICGINTGQHIYVDVDNAIENRVYVSVFAKGSSPRSFNIKITQLERDFAPDDCLQFYTEPEGYIKSFNYDQFGTIVESGEATYLNNLNYAICIKRVKQMCTILYQTNSNGEPNDFQIVNKDDEDNDIIPKDQAGAGAFACPNDFIILNQIRLCGERINDGTFDEDFTKNADVRDSTGGPIIASFRSDSAYVGRGFFIMYKQELCI